MKYVALLRGINVGGKNKIDMKMLKKTFERKGLENVVTYINSGNVIFETDAKSVEEIVEKIEEGIKEDFHLNIRVLLRDYQNIKSIVDHISKDWLNNSQQRTDIMFLWNEVDEPKVLEYVKQNPDVDVVEYFEGSIIWHLDKSKFNQSKMNDLVGTKLYKQMTVRNINTVRKLVKLLGEDRGI
ncbi:DUF1697 domain-containing protein [Candidatus Gracilibacteria bacterium]|nr:DUF1697 domain-containing protein [Candidatus Gracilibacteria bacterium]NJS41989.1 DUF1697 domain-containing protein [Candidatus Gracilibacteria bacterium]